MDVLRRCPLAIAQRLVHCAIAVLTAVLGQSHKDNVRCTAVDEQLGQLEAKRGPTCSAQLHLPTHDLFWANLRVQLHLPPLRSLDLLISPVTLRGCTSGGVYVPRMPGECCRRRLRSLLLCLCDVFPAVNNSFVWWFCTSALALALILFQSVPNLCFENNWLMLWATEY